MTRDVLADGRAVVAVAVAVPPVLFGVLAVLTGYPLPANGRELLVVAGSAATLATVGASGWWCHATGRRAAAGVAVSGVLGAAAWSLLAPGVSATRVGESVVVVGEPVLARFAGASPLLLATVGIVAVVEPVIPGLAALTRSDDDAYARRSRRAALELGAAGGAAFAVLSVFPAYLLGVGFGDVALLGFAVGGGFAAATVVGYAFTRHRLVTPLLAVGVVASAATVAVTAGGSPRGFPTAWVVWFVPGLALGGIEALGRRFVGR